MKKCFVPPEISADSCRISTFSRSVSLPKKPRVRLVGTISSSPAKRVAPLCPKTIRKPKRQRTKTPKNQSSVATQPGKSRANDRNLNTETCGQTQKRQFSRQSSHQINNPPPPVHQAVISHNTSYSMGYPVQSTGYVQMRQVYA